MSYYGDTHPFSWPSPSRWLRPSSKREARKPPRSQPYQYSLLCLSWKPLEDKGHTAMVIWSTILSVIRLTPRVPSALANISLYSLVTTNQTLMSQVTSLQVLQIRPPLSTHCPRSATLHLHSRHPLSRDRLRSYPRISWCCRSQTPYWKSSRNFGKRRADGVCGKAPIRRFCTHCFSRSWRTGREAFSAHYLTSLISASKTMSTA